MEADIICLTETWLLPKQDISHLQLEGFQLHHLSRKEAYNDSNDQVKMLANSKGGGVAIYVQDSNEDKHIVKSSVPNIECIAVKFLREDIIIVTIYRPPMLNVTMFLHCLKSLINSMKDQTKKCIFLGDFNEDIKLKGPIQTFMEENGYRQIVHFFTTEGGTTLDHVYIPNSIQIEAQRLSTFHSYHEAVALYLKI